MKLLLFAKQELILFYRKLSRYLNKKLKDIRATWILLAIKKPIAALWAAPADLSSPKGPLARFVFREKKDAKPRRALIRAALTNRSSGSPLHSAVMIQNKCNNGYRSNKNHS